MKRSGWLVLAAATAVVLAVVLVVFQPQKLIIDETVDEALPSLAASTAAAASAPAATAAATSAPATASAPGQPAQTTAPGQPSSAPAAASAAAPEAASSAAASSAPVSPTAGAAAPRVRGGAFRSLDHPGSGNARLLQSASGFVVRFDDLNVENGPDLRVYLSTAPGDAKESAFDDEFIDIGALKGNKGNQNYAIPADVDVSRFKSVVVWCRRFSSGFAVAPLA